MKNLGINVIEIEDKKKVIEFNRFCIVRKTNSTYWRIIKQKIENR